MKKLIALFLLACLCVWSAGGEENLMYMINVGKGDAIILFAGDKTYLVDVGKADAWESVEQALRKFGIDSLDGVFLTHTDKDHSGGLKKLAKSDIKINAWYASAYYDGDEDEHPMVKAALKREQTVTFLKAGDTVDGIFFVLAPDNKFEDEDDNSLVMRFEYLGKSILLTGDIEEEGEQALLKSGESLVCDIFKVPNHADGDTCGFMELKDLDARFALISTDPYDKPGTPDEALIEKLTEAGMEIYATYKSENGILVTVDDGEIQIKYD